MIASRKKVVAHHQRSKSTSKLPSGIEVGLRQGGGGYLMDGSGEFPTGIKSKPEVRSATPSSIGEDELIESTEQPKEENGADSESVKSANGAQHYMITYSEEWSRLFRAPDFTSYLKSQGVQGRLRSCRFRSICWKIYLECLSDDQSTWVEETKKARATYAALKNKFLTNPRMDAAALDLIINNPLSQEETSPWNRFFQDSELKITIKQDVIRTFPEIEFFHSPEIREMMVNILFCYAREYPDMSYKQGMHELLAPLIFVLHSDQQAFLHALEMELVDFFEPKSRDVVKQLLDPAYIEHDAFFMFSQVMEVVDPWYSVKDIYPYKLDSFNIPPFARPQDLNPSNVIVIKLTRVQDQLLKRHDLKLFHHLEKLEIAPQIYGIRWLRLLFGREFPLQDLLVVWDAIFADSMAFDLVDYIFIAMLRFIRDLLLDSDYATCLNYLMRYPAVTDVQYIIDEALHLKDPQNYGKPTGYSVQMLHHVPTVGGRPDIHRAPLRKNSIDSNQKDYLKTSIQKPTNKVFSTLQRKMASRPRSLALNQEIMGFKTGRGNIKASSEPATFESRSPSPTLTEYVQVNQENLKRLGGGTYSSLTKIESELQPMSTSQTNKCKNEDEADSVEEGQPASPGSRSLSRKGSWVFLRNKTGKEEKEDAQDIAHIQGQLNEIQAMCTHCSQKMTIQIDRLQECILRQNLENEDDMLVALAGLKQVRDILKGTLKFSENLLDGDDIVISDNHYPEEPKTKLHKQNAAQTKSSISKIPIVKNPPVAIPTDSEESDVNMVTAEQFETYNEVSLENPMEDS